VKTESSWVVIDELSSDVPGRLASGVAMPSKRAKTIEPTDKEKGTALCVLGSGQEEPGTGAYIDAEGRRIENRPERACGTNGWAVICP
jgi:hypothetical protein